MSPAFAKRRKLGHDAIGIVPTIQDSSEGESEDGVGGEDEVPKAVQKQMPSKPKQTRNDDESAIYSGGLFKSNVFKYQVDYMLEEARPNYEKKFGKANETLGKLKELIEATEPRKPLSLPEAIKTLQKSRKIIIPFPNPRPANNANYKFSYEKPANINVVGSYPLKTMAKISGTDAVLTIDMIVIMPSSIFQEKDYLNYRYFYKRAYYLACIAAGIQDALQDDYTVKFKYLNGNELHPILAIKPKSDENKSHVKYEIQVIPAAPVGFFPKTKVLPGKNSVRPKEAAENAILPATPFYNSSLGSDTNFEEYLKILHSASKQSEGFRDAAILGRAWLRQRNLGGCVSRGGFGNFEWASLMALLLKGGGPKGHSVLSPGYSSYQMFKALLQFIATSDMASKPFFYDATDVSIAKSDSPVFYDGPRGQNILYKMTPWSYALLRDEAQVSLEMLNNDAFDQFEATFVVKASEPLLRYDCVIHVPFPASIPDDSSTCDHIAHTMSFARRVYNVLREGLMDRVQLINITTPVTQKWSTKSHGVTPECPLLVYIVFDPANIDRLVDHGPSAEEKKKAAKFQKFWGDKAELRRFKDGSILESLIWSPGSTYTVFQDIVTYLVTHHFSAEVSEGLRFIGESFAKAVPSIESSTKAFESLKQAFQVLENNVRDLEGLPLQLRQLSSADAQLRGASLYPPNFGPHSPLRTPADVLIQFEGSGRWPDDIVAIQRTKIAFLLKIGEQLQEANGSIETRVGIENQDNPLLNCAFLDIKYETGAVFRMRIHNDREQTLLERLIKDKLIDSRTRDEVVLALSTYKRMFLQLPVLTQSISTHCTRFPLLSPTIRLVKLWFERHMLSGQINGELVEHIVARTFMLAYPWRVPSSVMTGFLRTLMFIERWDWRHEPLVVDFTGTMTSKDVASANTRLEAWRKIDPGMSRTVIFAASNHDTSGIAFTDQQPPKVVAARMTSLATSAYKLVKEKGFDLDQRSLFATSTTDYDFVIHFSPKFANDRKRKDSSKPKFKNLAVQSEVSFEDVGYDPVQLYIEELEKTYTNSVVFFHGRASDQYVGGLWNPQSVASRSFKVNLAYATQISAGQEESELENVEIDKSAILSEIARLGGEMVLKIEVHK